MNHAKLLQELTHNLNAANNQPLKMQEDMNALIKHVNFLTKFVAVMYNTLPKEQQDKIEDIMKAAES